MPRKRHHKPIVLTDDERRTLEQWTRRPTTAQRLASRSRMVLACAEGLTNRAVAKRLRVSSNSVCKWRDTISVWPGLLVCGLVFGGLQFFWSNFVDYGLVDIVAGLGTLLALYVLTR